MTKNQTLMMLSIAGILLITSCASDLASEQRILTNHLPGAEKGDAWDQCVVGSLYWQGHKSIQNHAEAAKWLTKSANQGEKDAQLALGCLYFEGEGVPQSDETALKWFEKAAQKDNADANHLAGLCYRDAKGCKANRELAIRYFSRAYGLGCKEAGDDLANLMKNTDGE